jgi:hypothetical protein
MAGRFPGWVALVALVAIGCTRQAGVAGVRGPVGPQSGAPAVVAAPVAAAPSASEAVRIPGAPRPPSPIYGVAADGALLPSATLTSGVADPTLTAAQLCKPGYVSAARRFSAGTKRQVFADYGVPWATRAAYRVDELIPLSLGGLPQHRNLWPVPAAGAHGIAEKDSVETKLRHLVCAGTLPLATAQQALATDWFAAEQRYGTATPVPVVVTGAACGKLGAKAVSKYAAPLVCASSPAGKVVWVVARPKPAPAVSAKPAARRADTGRPAAPATTKSNLPSTKVATRPTSTFKVPVAPPGLAAPAG